MRSRVIMRQVLIIRSSDDAHYYMQATKRSPRVPATDGASLPIDRALMQ
jgi:hypothetical protein